MAGGGFALARCPCSGRVRDIGTDYKRLTRSTLRIRNPRVREPAGQADRKWGHRVTRTQLSNPFSTGGGGVTFETRVQASFAALMLAGGFAPCLPPWPITQLQTQAKFLGYETDDLVVWVKDRASGRERRLLIQIKHRIRISKAAGETFPSVIEAAWVDFNNGSLFTQGEDQLALVTGPVSSTDHEVRELLEWARATPNSDEFVRKVEQADFSSQVKRQKLDCFRVTLGRAKGEPVSDEELHRFLQHFHLLGYDLDLRSGVTLSLLQSLIGQYSPQNAQMMWSRLIEEMQSLNLNAGAITRETVAEDLRDVFVARPQEVIPPELSVAARQEPADWSGSPHAASLAIAVLLGGWDESKDADRQAVEALAGVRYEDWIAGLRELLVAPGTPLTLTDAKWRVSDRGRLWADTASMLFDDTLTRFRKVALLVLGERDPRFDLPPDERYAAAIHGKVLKHSHELRSGIAEGLALVGSRSSDATHVSRGKPEAEVAMAVREVLADADWIVWAGLNDVLPSLAEASPSEFLDTVEDGLRRDPCPFDGVFGQEGGGITGQNYMTGLLWGLESLAWDSDLLVRVVVVLGDLASRDPGGNWANRPENSIRTILLPWLPQTLAPVDKRIVAARTLSRERPGVGWALLLSLLPNQHQTSTGSFKPVWRRTIPEGWEKGVSGDEYWTQVSAYSNLVVAMADGDLARMRDLVDCLPSLPRPAFDAFLKMVGSDRVKQSPETERVDLWESLIAFANKHTKFAHTDWALPQDAVARIEDVAAELAPEDEVHRYRRYFSGRDFDLFESYDDFDHERDKLEDARQEAVNNILQKRGVGGVLEFAASVEARWQVGRVLGVIGDTEVDGCLLPEFLDTSDAALRELTAAFCRSRYASSGWGWVDNLDRSSWTSAQVAGLLTSLPFIAETWDRVDAWLGDARSEYWSVTGASPYEIDGQHDRATEELLGHGRPIAALRVLHWHLHGSGELNNGQAVRALVAAVNSKEPPNQLDAYEMVELIKALQERNPSIDELPAIEWAYLSILDGTHGAMPIVLDRKLASDPAFFMEVVRLIYRSKKTPKSKRRVSEQERVMGLNAWRLLHQWKLTPGSDESGALSVAALRDWLKTVCESARESGHLEVALTDVGHVLFHSPADPDGLWVNHGVAELLNERDSDDMRAGYRTEAYNSRGVHWVDPAGAPERELARAYRAKAEAVENAGYQRFAATLRQLADSYDAEADRIIDEHEQESDEDDVS